MRRTATTVVFTGKWTITRALRLFVCLALLICGAATNLRAQTTNATINGQITDAQGGIVPGVEVQAVNIDTNAVYPGKTNNSGIYVIPSVPPGRYRLVVLKDGFKEINKTGLVLNVQDTLEQNFALQVGSVSESVTVTGGGININTTDASVSTIVDRQFVENMPLNGRSFQSLLTLAPGVSLAPAVPSSSGGSGELTVNGQRTEANYFTVDGVSANTGASTNNFGLGPGYGGAIPGETALSTTQSLVPVDALQEFRANTSTYSAEYGRTPGGQFAFTTRAGTNDWHGSAFDYFRNEVLDANNWFNNLNGVPRQPERQNDFGGTLGGPILVPRVYDGKDKAFFFFSYEGLRLLQPQAVSENAVPDATLRQTAPAALQPALNAFPLPNGGEDGLNDGLGIYRQTISYPSDLDNLGVRIDYNINEKFKIFGRFADTRSSTSSYNYATKNSNEVNVRTLTLGTTNAVNSRQSNELRFNITQNNFLALGISTGLDGATPFSLKSVPGPNGPFPTAGASLTVGLGFGGGAFFGVGGGTPNSQRQFNITDTYAWSVSNHAFKFGVDWRRLTTSSPTFRLAEQAFFESETSVLANNVDSGFVTSQSPQPVEPVYRNFSAFVEDEWKVARRVSLSLGLRWDVNPAPGNLTGPSPFTIDQITNLATAKLAPSGTPLWDTEWHALAPRVGVAYQLGQAAGRETVIRAGFGIFYDMGNAQGSQGFQGVGFFSAASYSGIRFPFTPEQLSLPPASITPPYGNNVYGFDPHLALPYTLQWNLAVEQSLGSSDALTINYVGSGGRKLLGTFDYFPSQFGNPNFSPSFALTLTTNQAASSYNALQLKYERRLSHGLQLLASYTWSHSIDDATSNFLISELLRGSSDFDIRQNFQLAASYDIPGGHSNHFALAFLQHWALDARVMARSALPLDIIGTQSVDPTTGKFITYHPDRVLGQPLYIYGPQYPGGRLVNFGAFQAAPANVEGDAGRNAARGFGATQADVALRREFPIHERLRLQFRAEAFNLFNHPAFAGVSNCLCDGPYSPTATFGFGAAQSTLNSALGGLNPLYQIGGPRSLQLMLKLQF